MKKIFFMDEVLKLFFSVCVVISFLVCPNLQHVMSILGSAMNKVLHDSKSMPETARPGPRVKPEAEMIAMKNRGSMNSIMRTCTPRYN